MADDKEQMQQRYMQLQLIDQQVKQLQQHIQMLDAQIVEFNNTKAALDDLEKAKTGSDMMVTVAPGIFAKGELKNNKELLVNVGSDVLVEKDVAGAKKLIENQVEEIKKTHDELLKNLQELILQAQSIEKEFEKFSENV